MPARERRKRTHARPSQVAVARRKCTPVHACSLVVGWCECVFVSEYVCRRWLIAVVLVGAGRWSYRPASWPACTHNTVTSCVCLIAEPQWYTRVCVVCVFVQHEENHRAGRNNLGLSCCKCVCDCSTITRHSDMALCSRQTRKHRN